MKTASRIARWYPDERRRTDLIFRKMIYEAVHERSRVLDVGAGTGEKFAYDLKQSVAEMVGVDMDGRVEDNPLLDRSIVSDFVDIPVEDGCFDVVFSRFVFEHVAEPQRFLDEMHRILRPGGRLLFITPNKWHYVSVIARLTPHWFHEWFNSRFRRQGQGDTFPTFYHLNTASTLRRQLIRMAFEEEAMLLCETKPDYLMWSVPSFYLGLAYERTVNFLEILKGLRVHLIGCFVKKA